MERAARHFPKQRTVVETGVIRFGDDWPGVFISGDACVHYAQIIEMLLDEHGIMLSPLKCVALKNLAELLKSSTACLGSDGEEGISEGES
jgi:hypothetical protein